MFSKANCADVPFSNHILHYEDYFNYISEALNIPHNGSILSTIKEMKEKAKAGESSPYALAEKVLKITEIEKTIENRRADTAKWQNYVDEADENLMYKEEEFDKLATEKKVVDDIILPSGSLFQYGHREDECYILYMYFAY